MEVLNVNNLWKNYPTFSLQDVSFSVPYGSIVGFIGRNGAGKTTTLKCIYGLVHADKGEVLFDSKSIAGNEIAVKNDIGLVFGGFEFYLQKKLKTLKDVVSRFYPNWDDKSYDHWMKLFALDENKRMKELSNGMKVKFSLALALSHHAKLLLLDEPTSGLDPISRDELLDAFLEIVSDGEHSILFSTHVISDLERCADHLVYIRQGKIIFNGMANTFKDSYRYCEFNQGDLNSDETGDVLHCRHRGDVILGLVKPDSPLLSKAVIERKASMEETMLALERGESDESFDI